MSGSAYLRFTASVIFVALGLWLGAGFFLDAEEKQRTVTAEEISVSDEQDLAGIIVREEQILLGTGDDIVLAQEGQWLSKGDTAAVSRNAAKAYFDYLSATPEGCDAENVYEALCAFSVSKNREKQRSAAEKAAEFLFGAKSSESEHIPLPREITKAEASGYFTRFCDGCEGMGTDDDFSHSSLSVPTGCIGKIVDGDCWFFVAQSDEKAAERLRRGMNVTIDGYPASVEEILPEKIVFRVHRGVEAHLTDRERTLTLGFCRYRGIAVPPEAVCREGEDIYIRILHIGETEKLPVEIIYSDKDLCLVRGEGLVTGMQILVS